MYTALNIQRIIVNSLGVLFNYYKVYFKEGYSIMAKILFSWMFFFSFFAVLHVCSISFYNFFGLAVTKSLTGKGGKNCLIFSYAKGLIVLFCAPFTHLCPQMPCAYVRWLPQFFASSSLLAHKLFCFLLLFLLSYSSWALPQI